ncbi:MAG: acyl-CoA dehydrogenase family protein [Caulobacterales bacterium]
MTSEADHPLVARARELAAKVAPRGAEIEAARRLPDDIRASLAEAGYFRMFIEERLGGLEVSPGVVARVCEALARGDGATGWVTFIGATTALALSRMTDEAVGEIFAKPTTLMTGVPAPMGVATKVAGGFRVKGRWQWGSGSPNADWIAGGCTLVEDGKPLTNSAGVPRSHLMFFPADKVTLLDTWDVTGLCGTGSTDFEVDDLFVPDRHASGVLVRENPDRPLFRFPPFGPLSQGVAAVGLGIARAAIDEFIRLAGGKRPAGATAPLAERAHVQIEVARAQARLASARAFFYESIEAAWAASQTSIPALSFTRDMRLATAHAAHEAAAITQAMYTLAGGTSVYRTSPLQRYFRDANVATQHAMVSTTILETAGRLLLGLEANTARF